MLFSFSRRAAAVACALILSGMWVSGADAADARTEAYQRDRAAILAMAGTYKVTFDFRETVSFVPEYMPLEPKKSSGNEVVRVIEDAPGKISLQHILVAEADGKQRIVKHWRQDWLYEPATILTYTRKNRWDVHAVPAGERAGAWSQSVWQTDDSPRYAGTGRWTHEGGASRWTSNATLRPLARRDAIREPVYDFYLGVNRHALTPGGWVHEQDNAKMQARGNATRLYVHEVVLNTYARFDGFDAAAADSYWAKTKSYWEAVRRAWSNAILKYKGVSLEQHPDAGSVTGRELMALADKVAAGELAESDAVAAAERIIGNAAAMRNI
jgi:hypothetical protein